MSRIRAVSLFFAVCLAWAPPLRAQAAASGSLLLFPEYDTVGIQLLTVTNTNSDSLSGSISTRWVYVNSADCTGEQFEVPLLANDTYTVHVGSLFQTARRGFAYVVAASPTTGAAISFNWLVGASWRLDPVTGDAYEIAPVPFRAFGPEGAPTDVNADGRPALDGIEYQGAPSEIFLPRFLGQGVFAQSEIVLVSLAGTANAPTVLDVLAFNDNEEVFSTQALFQCWQKRSLDSVSSLFLEGFLDTTNNNPSEIFGLNSQESGWMRINGRLGIPPFSDTAVMAFLVDRIGNRPATAAMEGLGVQFDGLLPLAFVAAEPPVCTTDVVIPLWPANHQIVDIDLAQVAGVTDPASLPITIAITSITQDEPVNGRGDGITICDGSGVGTAVARIRAERAGNGNGRVYVVNYTATNGQTPPCSGRITVQVPHSQNGALVIDDGQGFASTEGCP